MFNSKDIQPTFVIEESNTKKNDTQPVIKTQELTKKKKGCGCGKKKKKR